MKPVTTITVLDLVHRIGADFALDTRDVAELFFNGDLKKAYKVLNETPGLFGADINQQHALRVKTNGKLATLMWQIWSDDQDWTRDEAAEYIKGRGGNPNKIVHEYIGLI